MTFNEFKHWLDGFCEGFGNTPPNDWQWNAIKEKMKKVNDDFSSAPNVINPIPLCPIVNPMPAEPIQPYWRHPIMCETTLTTSGTVKPYTPKTCGIGVINGHAGSSGGFAPGGNTHGVN